VIGLEKIKEVPKEEPPKIVAEVVPFGES